MRHLRKQIREWRNIFKEKWAKITNLWAQRTNRKFPKWIIVTILTIKYRFQELILIRILTITSWDYRSWSSWMIIPIYIKELIINGKNIWEIFKFLFPKLQMNFNLENRQSKRKIMFKHLLLIPDQF